MLFSYNTSPSCLWSSRNIQAPFCIWLIYPAVRFLFLRFPCGWYRQVSLSIFRKHCFQFPIYSWIILFNFNNSFFILNVNVSCKLSECILYRTTCRRKFTYVPCFYICVVSFITHLSIQYTMLPLLLLCIISPTYNSVQARITALHFSLHNKIVKYDTWEYGNTVRQYFTARTRWQSVILILPLSASAYNISSFVRYPIFMKVLIKGSFLKPVFLYMCEYADGDLGIINYCVFCQLVFHFVTHINLYPAMCR